MSEENKNTPAAEETVPAKKPGKKKLIIIIAAIAVVVIAAVVLIVVLTSNNNDGSEEDDYQYTDVSATNYYGGVVEPQQTSEIAKDPDRTVSEVYVKVGDIVKKGDQLFSYDTEETRNKLSKAKIEYESLQNDIAEYDTNIAQLTRQRSQADANQQLDYTAQIQEKQTSKSQAELNLKIKQVEIDTLQSNLDNSVVTSPIDGIIKQVASDSENSSSAFITVLMNSAFRIRAKIDENNVRGLEAGTDVIVHSRIDADKTWRGTISKVDTSDTADANNQNGGSETDSASKYNFYVSLDNSDGLLMGEHVYIEVVNPYASETNEVADAPADNAAETSAEDAPATENAGN